MRTMIVMIVEEFYVVDVSEGKKRIISFCGTFDCNKVVEESSKVYFESYVTG
jgi:hypothetical protein